MIRVEFRLSMPGVGSWNGKWSGAGRNYSRVRSLKDQDIGRLKIPRSWHYSWDDGWAASVSARIMEKGERKKKSDGFCGYDWMIDNIIRWGTPKCQHEFRPETGMVIPPREGEWEECKWCRMSRKVAA